MKKNMKRMGVVAALAIVAWGAVPAWADDNPGQFWTFASSFDEGLILGENFEGLNVGDRFDAGPLSPTFLTDGEGFETPFLVANDNADLTGNHFDGDSAGGGIQNVFSYDDSPGDHGAPSNGSYYMQATSDNHGNNFSMGVWNSGQNTQYGITYDERSGGWGWGFGPNAPANSGPDVFDGANAHTTITRLNMDGGFVASYSFLAVEPKTGASWGHGGADGVPNHIAGFSTPTLRVYYDARGGQNIDMDDFRIATLPWIPEPASFALLGLGSLLMLRRRV